MLDEQRVVYAPTPHLRTRPTTMLTALGLCAIIMLIQFAPGMQDRVSRAPSSPIVSSQHQ